MDRLPEPEAAKKGQQTNRRNRGGRRKLQWSRHLPFIARALVLCRDSLLVAGGANLPDADGDSGPGTLRIVARRQGAKHTECALSTAPVLDGMIVTDSGVCVCTVDGNLVCLGGTSG
ncbi:MAG: hypothetical protein ACQESR_16710 [Planctomycetota bacterium]